MTTPIQHKPITIAQISDSHLFAELDACHHGANVYQNLLAVLKVLENTKPDIIIFTGDLTQDHSEESYQHFANAFKPLARASNCYFVPGNHDEITLLNKYLSEGGFFTEQEFSINQWQFLLLNSKSDTPAGFFNQTEFNQFDLSSSQHQFVFMHHHPINVDYFIDRHGLKNPVDFWQCMEQSSHIKGIACGHVHRALEITATDSGFSKPLYTCPATSIQFDPSADTVKALDKHPAFRWFEFHSNGDIHSEIVEVVTS